MAASLTRGWFPRVLLAVALLFPPAYATAQVAVPPLTARVTDLTGTLTADQAAALEAKLAAFEARKGSQVAVLMVPTTQPETIEQYSIRVVDEWKLGRKRVDDGVLLLIAKSDRKLRIEVGRGLEGAIPDAIAKRIIDEEITPRFKQGDFYGGVNAGVDRIAGLVTGEKMPPPAAPAAASDHGFPIGDWILDLLLYGFVAVLVVVNMLQSLLGRVPGSAVVGVVAGILGYVLGGLALAVVAGIIVFILCLFFGSFSGGSGWSSGGSGWSSGSSGGFSGGGGGFSGGGASGSW